MKKLFILFIALLSVCISQKASAYDFSAVNDKGDTIYYGFTSGSTVEVVHEGYIDDRLVYHGKYYKGNIIIPANISFNGRTYIVNAIGTAAFWKCSSLLSSVTMPETIITINDYAFYYCENLNSVNIPFSTISIGVCAFENCSNLQYINIPNSVISIKTRAFIGCGKIKTLIIGNSVELIESHAFSCNGFIISYPKNPPIVEQYPFGSGTKPILVPCESVEAYRSAPNWDIYNYNSCIGLEDINKEEFDIIVYPNPAKDNIIIKTNQLNGGNLFIYDIMGRELTGKQINNDETIVDISSLNSGIYILKAISKDNKIVGNRKFIKQ